ncbi:MFS transporter [Streptomyces hoynatensis]|uniref:MFS transporter n=1 Tax=Streptomyces hoynatensis TaxID=1141874 RepID=A0A3A9Z3A9_9ACTN|nr:MFS transporter [Streptomyces hoynatensis]RKN41886.1 MFS transporter [Streptomyces hoynatensis]
MGPGAAAGRFAAVSFLFWLQPGLCLACEVLLMTERGLSVAVISGLIAVYSLTVAGLELPTGGLSDVLARRTVLAASGLVGAASLLLFALGTAPWELAVAMVLMGAARALSSGPAEAWYVDAARAAGGTEAELRRGLAGGATASSLALALGTLLGGGLPWLLGRGRDPGAWLRAATGGLVLPLSVPVLLAAAVALAFVAYVLVALPEPPRPRTTVRRVLRGVPAAVLGGLRLGARDALLRRVLLSSGSVGAALITVELLTPGRAEDLTGAPESAALLFAALACGGYLCTALGSHGAPWTARLAGGGERAVCLSLAVGTAGLLLLGATAAAQGPVALALAGTGYGLVYLGLGAAGPNRSELLHRRVDSAGRATALSVQSLALQGVGAVAGMAAGALPAGPLPWLPGGLLLLGGTLLWARPAGRPAPEPPRTPAAA